MELFMDDKIKMYLEERLNRWAEWYSRNIDNGLGYPSCSLEYRLLKQGTLISSPFSSKPLPSHEEAEETEKWVKEMFKQNKLMASALRCQYFIYGGLRVKAKKLSISHTQFKYYVDMAHQWLAGCLTQKRHKKIIRHQTSI